MQALMNLITNPGITGLLGVVIGIALNSFFVDRREQRRLDHESRERREQWNREAEERKELRAHEARMQQEEARDRRVRAYARFLGMAQAVGTQGGRKGMTVSGEVLRVLAESYAEADVVALRQGVRQEAYAIFSSALEGSEHIIDTDDFVAAVRREQAEEEREP
jgi:hypothetical protein